MSEEPEPEPQPETQPESEAILPEPEQESRIIEVGTHSWMIDLDKVNEKLHKDIGWEWETWVEEMMPEATLETLSHLLEEKESWEEVHNQWYKEEEQRSKKKKKTGKVIYY